MSEFQNGCYKKTKHAKFLKKLTFLSSEITRTYVCVSGAKNRYFLFPCNNRFEFRPFALLRTKLFNDKIIQFISY